MRLTEGLRRLQGMALLAMALGASAPAWAEPVPVSIEALGAGFRLTRAGQPYFIQGAGGGASKSLLRALGGNSFRTWDLEGLKDELDEAQRLGLTVTVGIWLEHKSANFSYDNPLQMAQQFDAARRAIDEFKDHPALLMWGIGNEMEMDQENHPALWQAVQRIAAYAKKADPKHPTMTVVAEIGQEKLAMIARYCPSIDVVGINAYGGAPSLAERYRQLGGVKPYVLTEFGPPGPWEVEKTSWGAAIEASSTDKSEHYRRTYEGSVAHQPLSLGSYAFIWGHKQEATATWFGLMLPDGTRMGALDVLSGLWSGKPVRHAAPTIQRLSLDGPNRVPAQSIVHLKLDARSAGPDALQVEWVLQLDPMQQSSGGAHEDVPAVFPQALLSADAHSADFRLPAQAGSYRVFAYVRDGHGGGAVANVPLFVQATKP